MPLLGTPRLNCIYQEPGASVYLVDFGDGSLTLHVSFTGKITLSRIKHFEEIWSMIVIGLWERGSTTVDTWIEYNNETQRRFAEFFGFENTGFLKEMEFNNGTSMLMEEMQYKIPLE